MVLTDSKAIYFVKFPVQCIIRLKSYTFLAPLSLNVYERHI